MDEDALHGLHARRRWVTSPALASVLFFAAQLLLMLTTDPEPKRGLAGAAPDTPVATPVSVRVVAEIKPVEQRPRSRTAAVPASERALLQLLERDGSVLFASDEVEVVATPAREFRAEEVEVITSRRAKLVR